MSADTKEILIKRFKSFLWRLLGMIISAFLAWVLDTLQVLNFSPEIVAIVGLIIGEITKYLNVNLPALKKARAAAANQ